jgi:hypothetical protein
MLGASNSPMPRVLGEISQDWESNKKFNFSEIQQKTLDKR